MRDMKNGMATSRDAVVGGTPRGTFDTSRRATRRMLWWAAMLAPLALSFSWLTIAQGLPGGLGTLAGLVLVLLLVSTTVTDLYQRKICNWATYSAVAWGLWINGAAELVGFSPTLGAIGIRSSVVGAAGCFAVMLVSYSLARGGAGDVKLVAAIGALVGFEQGVVAIGVSYLLAGGTILIWSVWARGPFTLIIAVGRLVGSMTIPAWISRPTNDDRVLLSKPIPLAGFFAAGTLVVILDVL